MQAGNVLVGAGIIASATVAPTFPIAPNGTVRAQYHIYADVRDLETVEVLSNPDLLRDTARGLAELDRGELLSFEDVFGEPL